MRDLLVPVVAVPARNEEALLPRLVAALSRQTGRFQAAAFDGVAARRRKR